MRKRTANTRPQCPKTSRNKKPEVEEDDDETKQAKGFYACYLLTSLSPRFRGHTYIGFTVNPRRRIRQHNGELRSGALRTKKRRPWEMVFCIYGFPTNVSALQFEWAWQHPMESVAVRQAAASFKSFSGVATKIKLAYTMLSLPPWQSLNITVNYFSTKYSKHSVACPNLPEHMKIQVCPVDELPCYTEADETPLECHDAGCGFDGKGSCENTASIGGASNNCAAEHQSHSLARGTGSASNVQSCNDSKDDEECNVDLTYWNLLEFHNADYGFDDKENFKNATSVCIAANKGIIERRGHSLDEFPFCNSSSESASDVQSCNDSKHIGEYNVDLTSEEYNISEDSLSVPEVEHEQRFSIVSPPKTTPYRSTNGDVLEFADIAVTESSSENGKILTGKDDKEKAIPKQIEVIDLLSPSPGCRIMSSRKKRRVLTVYPHIIDLT